MLEIEIKAWVDDPAALTALLDARAQLKKSVTKKDVYYCEAQADPARADPERDRIARLRVTDKGAVMTVKKKSVVDGVEINQEHEVGVASADEAGAVLRALGFVPFLVKEKRSKVYQQDAHEGLNYELNELVGLGHFIEMETLAPDDAGPELIQERRAFLKARLAELGIPEDKVEPAHYMDLLRAKGLGAA